MKKLHKGIIFGLVLVLPFWLWVFGAFGATVYFDPNCADNNVASGAPDGTGYNHTTFACSGGSDSYYVTMADFNVTNWGADSVILFKRGETWDDADMIPVIHGASGHPKTVGSYGTGEPPIFKPATNYPLNMNGKNYWTFEGIDFRDKRIMVTGTNTIFNYCIFGDSNSEAIYAWNNGDSIYNNCLITNANTYGVKVENATDVTLNNTIIIGGSGAYGGPAYAIWQNGSGTITYNNCLITGNATYQGWQLDAGLTDGGGNQLEVNPGLTSYSKNTAYFFLSFDDNDIGYVNDVVAALPSGNYITFFTLYSEAGGYTTSLNTLEDAGHEIAIHTHSHTEMDSTTAFAVTSTNTNPTVDVDIPGTQIVLSCDEGGNVVTVDWSGADKSITDLKTDVSGKGWTITTTTGVNDSLHLSALEDSSGAQACPYTPNLDRTAPDYAFFREELSEVKDWITNATGTAPTTMAWPVGVYDATAAAYMKDEISLLGARGVGNKGQFLSSVPIYNFNSILTSNANFIGGETEAEVRAAARHAYVIATTSGGVYGLYAHNTGEFSPTQIAWYADELNSLGATLQTFGTIVAAIRASHATGDGLTYTKVYSDVLDARLKPGSPARHGADPSISGTRLRPDGSGNTMEDILSIGAYGVYRGSAGM